MAERPAILAVDDDPPVLASIARDLRHEYGERYRVLRADSGAAALDVLRRLKLQNAPVALLLSDQRMPGMGGVDFLSQAVELYPDAKRVLLTAYADTEAAIRAINEVKLDHYLRKPWDPPEENLYPVLTDLLDDWQSSFAPPFEGIRVVGHRWSSHTHDVKEFLARNQVPYQALDVEADAEEAAKLLEIAGADDSRLPVVFFVDGTWLVQPSTREIADRAGLRTRADRPFYDLVIVGGGPAGLAGAVYGASEGLSTVLVEAEAPGGQAGTSSRIENYLGFPGGLSGSDLARRAVNQARRFGAEILTSVRATSLRTQEGSALVTLSDGAELACRALLIATGVSYRKLEVPDAERLTGAGVYYGAATTEAPTCAGRDCFVLGAGNSAGQGALYLARFARQVTVLVRGASLGASMSQYLVDRIAETPNIAVRTRTTASAVGGKSALESICLLDATTGQTTIEPADALFVFIGAMPYTDWVGDAVMRDQQGFILSGVDLMEDGHPPKGWPLKRDPFWLETSVPGVFVAGDVRHMSVKRVASAVGEGSMAVQFIHQHLAGS